MEACKFAFAYGCLQPDGQYITEDHVVQQSDCTKAYTQASLQGTPTYIRLPKHRWPESWKTASGKPGTEDLWCKLHKALCGHPKSGLYWEQHCEAKVLHEGFKPIGDCNEWRSCYWHPDLAVLLIVYVDDIIMAGPKSAVAQ